MDFEQRLRELEALIGTDLFDQEYESLLNQIKAMPGPRLTMAQKMRTLLLRQLTYTFSELHRARVVDATQYHGGTA